MQLRVKISDLSHATVMLAWSVQDSHFLGTAHILMNHDRLYIYYLNLSHDSMYFVTTGYLACSVFLHDSHELGVLVVNTIRRVSVFIYLVPCMLLFCELLFRL